MTVQTKRLVERVSDWRGAAPAEGGVLKDVALLGAQSANGHRYSEAALSGFAGLVVGAPVFLDHQPGLKRRVSDLAGTISEAWHKDGRVRGSIATVATEAGRTLVALHESRTVSAGMSAVSLCAVSPDGKLVESVTAVESVDVVVGPATAATFAEAEEPSMGTPPAAAAAEERLTKLEASLAELTRVVQQLSAKPESRERLAHAGTVTTEAALVAAIKGGRRYHG